MNNKTSFISVRITVLLLGVLLMCGCSKDFEEINTNPNTPTEVQPDLLLRQVIYNLGDEMSYEGFVAGNLLAQYFTEVDFNLFDRHDLSSPQLGGNPWPVLYTNLRDNQIMLGLASESSVREVYTGPGLILKAYMSAMLTDIYGDVPYTEALQGLSGIVTPAYDEQETIYRGERGVLALLDEGIAAIDNYSGAQALQGDILFNGNLDGWKRFAQSLKIKYLMRISGRIDVSDELQALFDAQGYQQFSTDDAVFSFTDDLPNNFRMAQLRDGDFNLFILSETAEEILEGLDDPRLQTFYRPTGNDPAVYTGLLNGQDASSASISVSDYSLTGTIFRENTSALKANFMSSWETAFLLAEAAERGIINADAASLYTIGVEQSFEYWNAPIPFDYLGTGPGAYGVDGADPIEQILTQKWISNTINGYESWIEWRRTGFPALKTLAASLNGDLIPVRMPYPADEAALNSANYILSTGGSNDINARVWWDVD